MKPWESNRGHLTVWDHLTRTHRPSSGPQEPGSGGFQFRASHIRFNLKSFTDMKAFRRRRKKNAAEASKCNLSPQKKKTVWTVSLTSLSHQNFSLPACRSFRPPVLILIEFNFILQIRWPRSNSSHKHQNQCVLTRVCVCVVLICATWHRAEREYWFYGILHH